MKHLVFKKDLSEIKISPLSSLFIGFTSLCETYSLKASEAESCGTDKLTFTLNTYLGKIIEG